MAKLAPRGQTAVLVPRLRTCPRGSSIGNITRRFTLVHFALVANQIPANPTPTPATAQPVSLSVLTPQQVVQHFSADNWEAFVLEALGASEPRYARIERRGGAGDKGRDVIACTADTPHAGPFDLYQCKAYGKAIGLSDVWAELGKLCVFTDRGDFPVPRRYRFAAPHGVTTPLGNLLDKPGELRTKLIASWASQCESQVSQGQTFPLTGALKAYVEHFDFSIVHYCPVTELLDLHKKTSHWQVRFKRDYPDRPLPDAPPEEIQERELRYVSQLWAAYGDHLKVPVVQQTDYSHIPPLVDHFTRSRIEFFMADSLNRFYRDPSFPGAFEHVKRQVYDGVIDTATAPHADALARVRATVQSAALLPIAGSIYSQYVEAGDKKGLCHHLANDDKLRWVQP